MAAPGPRALSAAESAVAEENAVALGLSIDLLMENAGRAVAEEANRHLPAPPARVVLLAGPGNNGGDALAAAHYLAQWGHSAEVWLARPASEIRSRAARRCLDRAERAGLVRAQPPQAPDLAGAQLLVDGLLGTGQAGTLRPPLAALVKLARESGVPILSIDVPSGLFDPNGLRPRWTVALGSRKEGSVPENSGEIVVRDIGIPPEAWHRTGPGEFRFLPAHRVPEARGRSARVVVIGGGPYSGAPALAAIAALRSGAERATVLAPAGAAEAIRGYDPNLVVRTVGSGEFRPSDVPALLEVVRATPPDALVVGMGAGRSPSTLEALGTLLRALAPRLPLVVDADALGAIPPPEKLGAGGASGRLVATPNAGEFQQVFHGPGDGPIAERLEAARRIAQERRIVLCAKGEPDLLTDGIDSFENHHHHPAATVGGAGDVLGGVLGSVLAQGVAPLHAARLGTYWVGEAGLRAAARSGFGLVATDLLKELPRVWVAAAARIGRPE